MILKGQEKQKKQKKTQLNLKENNQFIKWMDVFYSISRPVGYLTPNPLYTYILNIHTL